MHKKKIAACISAAVWLLALSATAQSAGLGKLSIDSALGQPLQAEIDVIASDPTELANLHARLAGPDAFHNANLDLTSTITNIKFALDKKPGGGVVLKLTTNRPVNDPFIEMLVELDWGNGQMVREYTLLLDPPSMKNTAGGQNSGNLVLTPATTNSAAGIAPSIQTQSMSAAKTGSASRVTGQPVRPEASTESAAANANAAYPAAPQAVGPIKRGETLSEIAKRTKPDGIRLEQMLVGLYRSNEKAFDGNMNRLKTGQILRVPGKDEVAAISESEAVREVHLQTADWNSYRQKLAGEVAAAPAKAGKGTEASGKINSAVEDRAAAHKPGEDVLKLSKGAMPGQGNKSATAAANAALQKQMAQDDAAAKQKALQEANGRVAALEKNNQAMQKLLALKNQSMAEAAKNAAKTGPVSHPPVVKPPVVQAGFKPVMVNAQPDAWYSTINPLYLGAGAVGILLLALLGFMSKSRSRRNGLSKFENSILTNVDTKSSTVYGAHGGTTVNTNNTSFLTDFSQSGLGTLDTHEVDPIAEAEVYMAYGRDEQAEEILKEAMIKDPVRHEIKLKLLEIYAARNNLPAFETIATELYSALHGEHTPVWEKAAELGRKIDPKNPLYGGPSLAAPVQDAHEDAVAPALLAAAAIDFAVASAPDRIADVEPMPEDIPQTPTDSALDFPMAMDFDLEMTPVHTIAKADETAPRAGAGDDFFSADSAPAPAVLPDDEGLDFTPAQDTEAAHHFMPQSGNEIEFGHDKETGTQPPAAAEIEAAAAPAMNPDEFSTDDRLSFDFDFDLDEHKETAQSEPASGGQPDHPVESAERPITLDFSGIDLDLNAPITDDEELSETEQEVKTKFELAQVYQEMGDHENAREILQEVIAEGNERQQAGARALLQTLG